MDMAVYWGVEVSEAMEGGLPSEGEAMEGEAALCPKTVTQHLGHNHPDVTLTGQQMGFVLRHDVFCVG